MLENLRILASIKLKLFFVILCFQQNYCFAKAWNQKDGKFYAAQKIILNLPYKSAVKEEFDLSNNLSISTNTQEQIFENYLEYGLSDDLTLEAKLLAYEIRDKINLEINSQDFTEQSKFTLNYHKLDLQVGAIKNIYKVPNHIASTFGFINPGDYVYSKFGSKHNTRKWNIGGGFAYGRNFYLNDTFKDNFQEISVQGKYYPKLKSFETDLTIKFGFKFKDKWTISLGSYNTFNSQSHNIKPYIGALNAMIEDKGLKQANKEFYQDRLNGFLFSTKPSDISKIQLGVACSIGKNKEIYLDLFIDPFNRKDNNNSSLLISLIERF